MTEVGSYPFKKISSYKILQFLGLYFIYSVKALLTQPFHKEYSVESLQNVKKFCILKNGNVLEMDSDDGCIV